MSMEVRNMNKRAELYKKLYAMRSSGMSAKETAKEMNNNGDFTSSGRQWTGQAVHAFIYNYHLTQGTKAPRFQRAKHVRNTFKAPKEKTTFVSGVSVGSPISAKDALDLAEMVMASNLSRDKKRGIFAVLVG